MGIGPDDPARNPFLVADLPVLLELLDGPPTLGRPRIELRASAAASRHETVAFPLDATLGMPGLPQSGTGQTSLLTGEDAASRFGRHFGPWVPVSLRPLLAERNLLSRAQAGGLNAIFANAYPRNWSTGRRARWPAAPPLAARAAGLLTRHEDHLERGEAVASDIVNDGWRNHLGHVHLPDPTPREAGANLGRLSAGADLTLFAHYGTDLAGHTGGMEAAVEALERVDAFLRGILDTLPPDALLMLASDHGNLEDVDVGHTRNPILALLHGPGAVRRSAGLERITDVAEAVLSWIAG